MKIHYDFNVDYDVMLNELEELYPFCKGFYHEAEWGRIIYRKLTCIDKLEKEKRLKKELEYGCS